MDTNKIKDIEGKLNVTIHKNHLKEGDASYAKVRRNKAGMNNIIANCLSKTKTIDKATLVAAHILFKDSILELLAQGNTVSLFEIGTLYPCALGNIDSANPSPSEVPSRSLGFTPSQEALEAISKASVVTAQVEETEPVITKIEDLQTHKSDYTVTRGMPIRISGRRLRIAGNEANTGQVGLYFAPLDEHGSVDSTESDWIKIDDKNFFKNTPRFLELILPQSLASGKQYRVIVRTAAGRGKIVNKTVRTLVFDRAVTVA